MCSTAKRLHRMCVAAGGVAALAMVGLATARADDAIEVALDQAKVARIPANAQTLIVGNPAIADVTMLKASGSMVITGKGYGQTNLIALDKKGELVAESSIRVGTNGAMLLVQRGLERESLSCSPKCVTSLQLGDGQQTYERARDQITGRLGLATPSGQR